MARKFSFNNFVNRSKAASRGLSAIAELLVVYYNDTIASFQHNMNSDTGGVPHSTPL